jgi:hypothetical protein
VGGGIYADNTTSSSATCITRLQTFFIAAFSEIVLTSVNDDHPSDNAFGSDKLDVVIGDDSFCIAMGVSCDVA